MARGNIHRALHCWITFRSALSRSANGAASAVRRGLSTISQRGLSSARCRRNASRKRRLMRFRTTLPPIARGTVSPNAGPVPLRLDAPGKRRRTRGRKCACRGHILFGSRRCAEPLLRKTRTRHGSTKGGATAGQIKRRWRSGRPFRRLRSTCDGRGPGGATTRPGRSWSSCAHEIRALWRACDC